MYNNINLTASTRPQPDIYAILSNDDVGSMNGQMDSDALVMNMFDNHCSTLSNTTSSAGHHPFDDHPLSTPPSINNNNVSKSPNHNSDFHTSVSSANMPSNDFTFDQALLHFNMSPSSSSLTNNQYTPTSEIMDPFLPNQFNHGQESNFSSSTANYTFPTASRRHSVAVAGFNLRDGFSTNPFPSQSYTVQPPQPPQKQQQRLMPQQPPSFLHNKNLATVMESEPQPSMMHRASMPNIFLSEESRRQLTANIQQRTMSAKTTPTNTPPPAPPAIQFNQMPWSTEWDTNKLDFDQPPPPSIGRKRFYSQQFDSFPPMHGSSTDLHQFNSSNLCPLPMSGVTGRRASVATNQDIHTWNRKVEPNNRIAMENKRRASTMLEEPNLNTPTPQTKKLKTEDESIESTMTEDTNSEDYPCITEADLEAAKKDPNAIPRRQKSRYEGDEYTPKWVRYAGQSKEGYCDTCQPGKWLQLKNSAFWYHKQFFHGISSVSGKPFQKPLKQRAGDHEVVEGLCHQCQQYVPICNSKRKNNVLWYRHAHKCHIYDKPKMKGGKRASISVASTPTALFDQPQKIY